MVSVCVCAYVFVFMYALNDVSVQNCHGYNSFLTFLKTKNEILGYIVIFMNMSINFCPQQMPKSLKIKLDILIIKRTLFHYKGPFMHLKGSMDVKGSSLN